MAAWFRVFSIPAISQFLGPSAAFLSAAICAGCTTMQVQPLESTGEKIDFVCIKTNPKVIVPEFDSIIAEGFLRHGIATKVYPEIPSKCVYSLDYTATQAWDFVLYLKDARLDLYKGDALAAYASFHLIGGGGFDFSKWDSTSTKINPLIDQLLAKVAPLPESQSNGAIPADAVNSGHSANFNK